MKRYWSIKARQVCLCLVVVLTLLSGMTAVANEGEYTQLLAPKPVVAAELYSVFLDHIIDTESAPETYSQDLLELSEYYSQFPMVVSLILSIADLSWDLRIKAETFNTQVVGNVLSIDRIEVQFDTRSSVKLKFYNSCTEKRPFCVVSPADALLHELLHAKSILYDPEGFIADGGMSGVMYPFEHERKTILSENLIYKSMTKIDGFPRPLRNEHSGRPVDVSCITCIE